MMAKQREPRDPQAVYVPPVPMFAPCPTCGVLCLREKGQLVSACLALPHVCTTRKELDDE